MQIDDTEGFLSIVEDLLARPLDRMSSGAPTFGS